eukprot:3597565-Rhodomonas_salina.2
MDPVQTVCQRWRLGDFGRVPSDGNQACAALGSESSPAAMISRSSAWCPTNLRQFRIRGSSGHGERMRRERDAVRPGWSARHEHAWEPQIACRFLITAVCQSRPSWWQSAPKAQGDAFGKLPVT